MDLEKYRSEPLDFSLYEKYGISQNYLAYSYIFTNIELNRLDDIEYEFISNRFKVFHSSVTQSENGRYDLLMIAAQSNSTT